MTPLPSAAQPTIVLRSGDVVPVDAEAIDGQAVVDEAAVTGESAPVLREPVPGRHTVFAGTRLTGGWLRVRPLHTPVLRRRDGVGAPPWWPAAGLAFGVLAADVTTTWTGVPRVLALAILAAPLLTLAARAAAWAVEAQFWRGLRILPLAAGAVRLAARCDTLLLADGAVDPAGHLAAVAFHPLPSVSAGEVAAAAHRAGASEEGLLAHSIYLLARSRGLRDGAAVREPLCGPVGEVAAEVAVRGGEWPAAAADLEREIVARGAQCLAAADGGRPLGLIELRATGGWPSLDDALGAGLAISMPSSAEGLAPAAAELRAQRRRFAVACEGPAGGIPPAHATFTLASTAWGAARPTALDLDANVGKLPAVLLGARRLRRRLGTLQGLAASTDAVRAAAVVRAGVIALRGPAPAWGALESAATALAVAATCGALAVLAGIRRRAG